MGVIPLLNFVERLLIVEIFIVAVFDTFTLVPTPRLPSKTELLSPWITLLMLKAALQELRMALHFTSNFALGLIQAIRPPSQMQRIR